MTVALNHIALVVRDPQRTARLFEALFGVERREVRRERGGPETIVPLAGTVFVLVRGEPAAARTDDHVALTVAPGQLPALAEKLPGLGLEGQISRAGTPAQALYFVDYDNHLFELQERPFDLGPDER